MQNLDMSDMVKPQSLGLTSHLGIVDLITKGRANPGSVVDELHSSAFRESHPSPRGVTVDFLKSTLYLSSLARGTIDMDGLRIRIPSGPVRSHHLDETRSNINVQVCQSGMTLEDRSKGNSIECGNIRAAEPANTDLLRVLDVGHSQLMFHPPNQHLKT